MSLRAPLSVLSVMALTLVAMPPAEAGATPESEPQITEVEGLTLSRFVLTNEIVEREPVGSTTSFAQGAPVRAFLEVRNDRGEPVDLVVSFERAGQATPSRGVTLSVPPGRRYRTFAASGARRPEGAYDCVVRVDGEVFARLGFQVVAP